MTAKDKNAETMLKIFKAVEQRDDESMRELCQPDVEFCWSGSLPYGGRFRGVTRPWPDLERNLDSLAAHRSRAAIRSTRDSRE